MGSSPSSESFPKELRILKRDDFVRAVKSGRRFRNNLFSIAVYQRKDNQPTRLGLSATRKYGNAVVRNKAKRRAREVFRKNRHQMKPDFDLVVLFQRDCRNSDFDNFQASFLELLERACVIRKSQDR